MTAKPIVKLPEVAVEELLSRGPCWNENRVRAALSGRERWTALDILAAPDKTIPPDAKLWVVLHPQFLSANLIELIACWCVRHTPLDDGRTVWDLLTDERSRFAVEVAEQYARGQATGRELRDARAAADAARAAANAAAIAAANAAAIAAANAAAIAARAACDARAARAANAAAIAARAACDARAAADAARAAAKAADVAVYADIHADAAVYADIYADAATGAARDAARAAANAAAARAQIRGIERLIREYAQTGELPEIESET